MPGDVVLADPEGVVFIRPQLAERVVSSAELVHLREGKYRPGQIDARWTPEIEQEFNRWVDQQKVKRNQ